MDIKVKSQIETLVKQITNVSPSNNRVVLETQIQSMQARAREILKLLENYETKPIHRDRNSSSNFFGMRSK